MSFAPGSSVGPYRIIAQLGQGGMATVYKAYHAALDRFVALKVLHPAFREDPSFVMRFEREARVIAKLEHPNIVPIYDSAEHMGQPYLVMKFIEGETLKARLSRGPLGTEEAIHIVEAVGAALSHAHQQGILHRDIKPSNVLLTTEGGVYLADFGLARMAELGVTTLSADMLVGTPQYISPEQAQGARDLDAGTDIYSLGVVLYEIVVGRVPFTADTPFSIVHDHIYAPLPLPHSLNPNVPADVERVLLRALAKERRDRYPDVASMVAAFVEATRAAVTGRTRPAPPPVKVLPPALPTPAQGKARSKVPWWGWALAAVGLSLALALVVIAGRRKVPGSGAPEPPGALSTAIAPAQPLAPVATPDLEALFRQAVGNAAAGKELLAGQQFDTVRTLAIAENPAFLVGAADKLAGRQMWLQALRYYLAALQPSPANADLRQAMQETLYHAGNIATADLPLQHVVAAAPNWGIGLAALGRWEILNGREGQGAAVIERAKTLPEEGDSPFVQAVWAESLYRSGDKTGAEAAAKAVHSDARTPPWLDRELSKVVTQ